MSVNRGKHIGPALLVGVLALFFVLPSVVGQTIRDLPPPPPPPTPKPTPKPTPTPELKAEDLDVVRVSSNLVMVPVSVVDYKGEPVHGLQVKDFRLEEQGKVQDITELGNPDQVPLDIALLFDVSSSVSQKGFFEFQQAAAAAFLKQVLKSGDRASVFTIKDQPSMVQALAPSQTAAAKVVSIPAATKPVPTAFYDTVMLAAKYLIANSDSKHRRVIVVISDGDDNFSTLVREAAIAEFRANQNGQATPAAARVGLQQRRRQAVGLVQRAVQEADATFYSINPGGSSVRLNQISMAAQNAMHSIAEATGGTAFIPSSQQDLSRVFNELAAELRDQYLLQYYSNNEGAAGQFRNIAVAVPTQPQLRVRARQGYYSKKQ